MVPTCKRVLISRGEVRRGDRFYAYGHGARCGGCDVHSQEWLCYQRRSVLRPRLRVVESLPCVGNASGLRQIVPDDPSYKVRTERGKSRATTTVCGRNESAGRPELQGPHRAWEEPSHNDGLRAERDRRTTRATRSAQSVGRAEPQRRSLGGTNVAGASYQRGVGAAVGGG
jgi:hypothetical protein